ncbi:alpha/beta fold hydrolase [Phycicoccus sp. Root101]|uniref:alpha/beta fold hydrolase n=1 Tax=Phycicoccus sp. Root101 TaxID=1736421 RepID=UPI001F44060D|nr:alpha/beta hydrolase [Phycicoccus sp. Root101]
MALVHGAFADNSGWNDVVTFLQAAGVTVTSVANPLRGIAEDARYVASALRQIQAPVIAVGHSYGGAVISNAATHVDNVVGLVFVAGFAPDEGEVLGQRVGDSKDSVLNSALVALTYPTSEGGSATEFAINPAAFHDAFAGDLPRQVTDVMAVTQRPVAEAAFTEPSGPPAWKRVRSWAVVSTKDTAAGSDVVRAMAERAGASITEVDGSHVIMMSQPKAVADVILDAVRASTDEDSKS